MTRDYFYCLQSDHGPVNDLSTAVQLTNRLLRFWADGGFVHYKRVSSPFFLVWSQSLIVIITSWFAIALDEIRTRGILREKADCLFLKHGKTDLRILTKKDDWSSWPVLLISP